MRIEMRVQREIVVFAMLQDEQPVGFEQLVLKNQIGQSRQAFQCVWRVGKDKVELQMASIDILKYITPNNCQIID